MSDVAELAKREAALAEAELTDEEVDLVRRLEGEEGLSLEEAIGAALATREPAPAAAEPPAAEEPTGEPTAKQLRQLEAEAARHEKRVREIMGAFVTGMVACSKCDGLGLTPPGPQPREHPYFKACETCAGFGQVLTGSLRGGEEARDCPECKGRGYLEALREDGTPLAADAPFSPAPPGLAVAGVNGATTTTAPTTEAPPRFGTPQWMGDPTIGR